MADDDVVLPKSFGFPDGKIPSAEDLLAAVEKLSGLSEENKEELRRSILRGAAGRMAEDFVPPAAAAGGGGGTGTEMLILLGLISLVFSVILFVGYKLYVSLIVRNREREEKRRQKQLKKKK